LGIAALTRVSYYDKKLENQKKVIESRSKILSIKIVLENPVLWTGMKGASAESRKNKSDAETSSA
jgi:hypothetical protein